MSAKMLRDIASELEKQAQVDLAKGAEADRAQEIQKLAVQTRVQADVLDALRGDKVVYRIVVSALGAVAFTAVIGAILVLLLIDPNKTPSTAALEILTALGSASVGAIAGLLAPSPGNAGT